MRKYKAIYKYGKGVFEVKSVIEAKNKKQAKKIAKQIFKQERLIPDNIKDKINEDTIEAIFLKKEV